MILQQDEPDDFVIATGQQHSIRDLVSTAAAQLDMKIDWKGSGEEEKGYHGSGRCIVAIDPQYYRPAEVVTLLGDPSKAREKLSCKPKTELTRGIKKHFRTPYHVSPVKNISHISSVCSQPEWWNSGYWDIVAFLHFALELGEASRYTFLDR
jgi:hypothetical protein